MNEYEDRDSMQLDEDGGYYCRHIGAMTKEGLHGKSEIADELAYRDWVIDGLRNDIKQINKNTFTFSEVEAILKAPLEKFWDDKLKG